MSFQFQKGLRFVKTVEVTVDVPGAVVTQKGPNNVAGNSIGTRVKTGEKNWL